MYTHVRRCEMHIRMKSQKYRTYFRHTHPRTKPSRPTHNIYTTKDGHINRQYIYLSYFNNNYVSII